MMPSMVVGFHPLSLSANLIGESALSNLL